MRRNSLPATTGLSEYGPRSPQAWHSTRYSVTWRRRLWAHCSVVWFDSQRVHGVVVTIGFD